MRQERRRYTLHFGLMLGFSALSSASLLLGIPAALIPGTKGIFTVLIPLLFWGGLCAEQLLVYRNAKLYRSRPSPSAAYGNRPGVIRFCRTSFGIAADVVTAVGIIVLAILMALDAGEQIIQYILISVVVFSFRCHCIFNGKVFEYYQNIIKKGNEKQ